MGQASWKRQKKKTVLFVKSFLLHQYQFQCTKAIFTPALITNGITVNSPLQATLQLRANASNTSAGDVRTVCQQGRSKEVLDILHLRGIPPDSNWYSSLLQGCLNTRAMAEGKLIHAHIIQSGFIPDIVLETKLVIVYAKCGSLVDARRVFDEMPERNVISWTAMIAAYARHGHGEEALRLFYQMQRRGVQPNQFTYACILPACSSLAAVEHGKEVHKNIIASGFQSNVFVGSGLVDLYAKCARLEEARQVFDKMLERNVVSWNSMIAGYAHNGLGDEALVLFQKMPERNVASWNAMIGGYVQNGRFDEALNIFQTMQLTDAKPNLITFASVLPACANLAALQRGKEVHGYIIRGGFRSDAFVESALINMYAKSGSIVPAYRVFDKMPRQDVISWTAMIVGYAMHGYSKEALQLFQQMQLSGTKPDQVTFVGVLSACCHAGLVDGGWQYFNCMSRDYQITPTVEHYCCMVDLLGRAGQLDEARNFINKMPIKPDAAVWGSLLCACRIHNNIELGERVAGHLFEMDPKNSVHYVLLSNIYAAAGRWDDLEKVRKLMKERGVNKIPGRSWIEVNNKVYTFTRGDRSHPQTEKIYAKLDILSGRMKEAGYVPDMNFALHDVEEEQREYILWHHSEKLAISFGLINIAPRMPIRIVKNLRVCGDCHSAIKFISNIVAREIVVRDASRFHHFKDGLCSCGDYW